MTGASLTSSTNSASCRELVGQVGRLSFQQEYIGHMSTPQGGPSVTPERIMQLAWGYGPPLIIEAATRHGVFDHLETGPKTVEETATLSGASVRGLRAIMNALTGLGLLAKSEARYSLTPESAAFLVSARPGYFGGFFRHMSDLIPNWLHLNEVVQTGRPVRNVNDESE